MTVSLHELAEIFRANNIPVSEQKLSLLICEGKFPFAVGTKQEGRATLIIFKHKLYEWLREMCGDNVIEI